MKILQVTPELPPNNVGGIATHVYEISKRLIKNHDVSMLYVYDDASELQQEKIKGIKTYYLKRKGNKLNHLKDCRNKLNEIIKKEQVDVIHSHIAYANLALLSHKKRLIYTEHYSGFLMAHDRITGKTNASMMKRSYDYLMTNSYLKIPHKVITVSNEINEKVKCYRKQAIKITNGVDTSRFYPCDNTKLRQKYGIYEDDILVFTARRFTAKNGVIYLAKAMKQLQGNLKLMIVGDGPEKDNIHKAAPENTIFTGFISNFQVSNYINMADIVVLPSLMEAVSVFGLEAMACGKPLIGTNIGGIPEIIKDGSTGILVPPGDSNAIADAIVELSKDKKRRETMGYNAMKHIEDFTWDKITRKILRVYLNKGGKYET